MSILEDLDEEQKGWELSLRIRIAKRKALKLEYKSQEKMLKTLRSFIYQTDREIKDARNGIRYCKTKKSTLPSRLRQWAKDNPEKVINRIFPEDKNGMVKKV
jgi:hypothetical protein